MYRAQNIMQGPVTGCDPDGSTNGNNNSIHDGQ